MERRGRPRERGRRRARCDGVHPEAFRAIAGKRKEQVKVFLLDKSALDSLGNAYGDEVLWEARVHPKRAVRSLSVEELDRLHDAIVKVLSEARDEVARRAPPIDEKVRDFLKVRLRHQKPCPRCGEKIRKAGVYGHDAYICPACQPEERKGSLVDLRRAKPVDQDEEEDEEEDEDQ
jgi:formamidopyrimidine-DNA glycosylase